MSKKSDSRSGERETLLWGGKFQELPSKKLRRFNDSFSIDWVLFDEDINGSIVWARALHQASVISKYESRKIVRGLLEISKKNNPKLLEKANYEDIHTFIDVALTKKIGPLARKLHTGRSRNDQIATDIKLYLRKALFSARRQTLNLASCLARRAYDEAATIMPGYTHLKQAEPITFGHWCLAYVEMLLRDAHRLAESLKRANDCPLGSGALSGTPLKIDRVNIAKALGFARPTSNSLDSVSDRDTVIEFLFDGSLLLVHLSRLSEDLILYSSDEFGYLELPDSLATGSSRMPHKKNPDLLELVRGYAARSIGELAGLLALLKGLPLAYNKDLQLDKEPVFRLQQTLGLALPLLTLLIKKLKLNRNRMSQAASSENLLATGVVDVLAAKGIAFRKAHESVGRLLTKRQKTSKNPADSSLENKITTSELAALNIEKVLAQKQALGGTAPRSVKKSALSAIRRIEKLRRST